MSSRAGRQTPACGFGDPVHEQAPDAASTEHPSRYGSRVSPGHHVHPGRIAEHSASASAATHLATLAASEARHPGISGTAWVPPPWHGVTTGTPPVRQSTDAQVAFFPSLAVR
jgi:hypothetical protein